MNQNQPGKHTRFSLTGFCYCIIICSLLLLTGCASYTRIYLVRHAERGGGVNPHLTPDGFARAQTLKDTLTRRSIHMVLTSDSNRTRETATPTAQHFNLQLTLYRKDTIPGLVNRLRNTWGKNILLVTHSETIPVIMTQFGLPLGIPQPITGFNNLIIITRKKSNGHVTMSHTETTYGN